MSCILVQTIFGPQRARRVVCGLRKKTNARYCVIITWLSCDCLQVTAVVKCYFKAPIWLVQLELGVRVNFDGCLVQQHISAHQCILGIHMRIMCLTQSMWKVWNGDGRSMVETMPCCASVYPVHGSASKVNCSDADTQVVFCYDCLRFHPFVEQLTVFYVSGFVLASSSILRVLNLDATSAPSYHDGIMSVTCQTGTSTIPKPVHFNCKPITVRHTNTTSD